MQSSNLLLFFIVAALPDFAQVYSFIGSLFNPSARDHLEKLKKMDPINVETVSQISSEFWFCARCFCSIFFNWVVDDHPM